jgi:cell division protein FtsN
MIKNELGSSRMDTVLKMLLIAFVSLLAFSSGVYFGKQMSDSDHQLKALESDFSSQTYTASADEARDSGTDEQIEESEVATLTDKYVNGEKEGGGTERNVASADEHGTAASGHGAAAAAHGAAVDTHAAKAEAHGEEAHAAAPAKAHAPAAHAEEAPAAHGNEHAAAGSAKAGKVDLSAAHAAAQRVASNASPTATQKVVAKPESRTPTSLPKTVGSNSVVEFTVQVASYPTPEAAKDHANELVKKGFPAFPVEATVNGKTWFRVSVGSFKTLKDATTYRAQLLKQADLQSAIVQRITR